MSLEAEMGQDRTRREDGVLMIDLGAGVTIPAEVLDHRETETQDITQEELDEIERLDRDYRSETDSPVETLWCEDKLKSLGVSLLPRLARAYRKAEARLRHAHDIANKLYKIANALHNTIEVTPFDLVRCSDEQRAVFLRDLDALAAAIDLAEQSAALAEVQRRDMLETDLKNAHEAIEDLNQALDRARAKIKEEYARGRREAIEEAARHIRKGSEAARTIPGPGGEMVADALERAAKAIETHETEISK